MIRKSVCVGCCAVLAACGESATLQDAKGTLRVVAEVSTAGDEAKVAAALSAALAAHPQVAVVAALDAPGLRAVRAAAVAAGDHAPQRVMIDATAGTPAPGETIVVEATGAAVAVEVALLACHGIALPPRVAVGTHVVTAADASAGGVPRLAPGDLGIEMLRRQHPDVITTTPNTDVIFAIAFVQIRADGGFHDRVRDEVQAAVKRYPQLQLTSLVAGGATARLLGLVNECIQANRRVVLVSTDDWAPLQGVAAAMAERKIALVAIDPLLSAPHAASVVGGDQEVLGRAVGEAVRALLPGGGACITLHGDPGIGIAMQRQRGFAAALGLQGK